MIAIPQKLLNKVIEHAKSELPHEACGILAGRNDIIAKVYPMQNVSEEPIDNYLMKPEEQLKVFKEIRSQNLELLVIYHSHINHPAYPSPSDIKLAFYPEVFYMILSFFYKSVSDIKLFTLRDEQVNEELFRIINNE